VLVPPDDVEALAAASIRLANSPEKARAMADRAQQDARTRFSEQGHADRVSAIYEELVRAG
jgi:glycosyltransferase involved in cell wall biosynthesis